MADTPAATETAPARSTVRRRYSVEVEVDLLEAIDGEAARSNRSRVAETRVLLAEAVDARRKRTAKKNEKGC